MSVDRPGENYYENQFGDRIRNISKGGTKPPAPPRSGSGGRTAGGAGVVIGVIFLIRLLVSFGSSSSSHTSHNFNTPPMQFQQPQPMQIQVPPMIRHRRFPPELNPPAGNQVMNDEQVRRLLQQNGLEDPQKGSPLLTAEDVAFLPAFCRRLQRQGPTTELTPDRRVYDGLDADGRKLLAEIAADLKLEPAPEKRDEMLETLNRNSPRSAILRRQLLPQRRTGRWPPRSAHGVDGRRQGEDRPRGPAHQPGVARRVVPDAADPRSAQPLTEAKRKERAERTTLEAELLGIK